MSPTAFILWIPQSLRALPGGPPCPPFDRGGARGWEGVYPRSLEGTRTSLTIFTLVELTMDAERHPPRVGGLRVISGYFCYACAYAFWEGGCLYHGARVL